MAKIIVNATNKGGEGKTTVSINLAEYIAYVENKKVLCIDLDPQANLSGRYLLMDYDPAYQGGKIPPIHPGYEEDETDWDGRSSIADIFYGEEAYPYPTPIDNIELLPSHSYKLQEAETVTKSEVIERVHLQLKKFLQIPELQKEYDAIVIDTPPSKGPLTIAAFKAATHIVIPAQMEQFSIEGIYGMLQLWKQETYTRNSDNPIKLIGILPNQVRQNIKLHSEFLATLRNMHSIGQYVIPHALSKRVIYSEILVEGANPKSIFQLPESHVARKECEATCKYITNEVFTKDKQQEIVNV